ncbi:hypothetical protein ACVXG7_27895 [Enterobacter hormaechei]
MLKAGSAWMPDNEINGVDFVLPFRLSQGLLVAGHARAGNVTNRRGKKPGHSPKYRRGSQGDYPGPKRTRSCSPT